jgi:hypothetical protein
VPPSTCGREKEKEKERKREREKKEKKEKKRKRGPTLSKIDKSEKFQFFG